MQSFGMNEISQMVRKSLLRSLPKITPSNAEFIANLDFLSFSDTQIEPPLLEEGEKTQIELINLDDFDST